MPRTDEYKALFPDCLFLIEAAFAETAPGTSRAVTESATDRGEPKSAPTGIPERIGRYTVVSLPDEGGQGQVFRVVHPGLAKELVLKRAARAVSEDGRAREQLQAEETRKSLVAFVVRPGQPVRRVELGPIGPVVEAIDRWRPMLADPRPGEEIEEVGRAVRKLVWEPQEAHLGDVKTVLLSPDGTLGRIPFAALPTKKAGSYLVEERAVAVVPIPRLLADASTRGRGVEEKESKESLLVVGDVNFDGDPGVAASAGGSRVATTRGGAIAAFAPLDATAGEIASVDRWFRKQSRDSRADELSGAGATEEAFRREAPGHRYLHLATHGFFAPELRATLAGSSGPTTAGVGIDPGLLSGLALAGANKRPPEGRRRADQGPDGALL